MFIDQAPALFNDCLEQSLTDNWELAATPAASIQAPCELPDSLVFMPAFVPGTVAMAVSRDGWGCSQDYNDQDWWFKTSFDVASIDGFEQQQLCFHGLASHAEIWLNQKLIAKTDNMHQAYQVDISGELKQTNQLCIVFRALTPQLKQRHPRPQWKTAFLDQQNLRNIRTTLLDKVPSWSPPLKLVGPWRPVILRRETQLSLVRLQYDSTYQTSCGNINLQFTLQRLNPKLLIQCAFFELNGWSKPLQLQLNDEQYHCQQMLSFDDVQPWWPHTMGDARLYPAKIILHTSSGELSLSLNAIGFKHSDLQLGENTALRINGEAVFCRGSTWTVEDYKAFTGSADALQSTLLKVKRAGFNLLRIAGTMIYESQDFYRLCDELGIMVWQDFMLSHFDYPQTEGFLKQIKQEAEQQLQRLSGHACLVVLCGGSDVEQTAAMMGLSTEQSRNSIFTEIIPQQCEKYAPGVPYVANSPIGGDLPFSLRQGLGHYWGIGAFRQPLTDIYKTAMPFLTECLGFSHIPEAKALDEWLNDQPRYTTSYWKRRIPRDGGCSWDFDDVRDYYLEQLFKLDAYHLRSYDPERYFEISKRVPGEVMAFCFNEWRQADNICQGALSWFLKDLWPSAGYGLIDSLGEPKAALYMLARACQPQAVLLADRGMDGLQVTVCNDYLRDEQLCLKVSLLTADGKILAAADWQAVLGANQYQRLSLDKLLGQFFDVNYQHRFGPSKHDLVACQLFTDNEQLVSESYFYPQGYDLGVNSEAVLEACIYDNGDEYILRLTTQSLLQSVCICIQGCLPEDNYFNLLPGQQRIIKITKQGAIKRFRGYVQALNMKHSVKLKLS